MHYQIFSPTVLVRYKAMHNYQIFKINENPQLNVTFASNYLKPVNIQGAK